MMAVIVLILNVVMAIAMATKTIQHVQMTVLLQVMTVLHVIMIGLLMVLNVVIQHGLTLVLTVLH